MQNLIDKLKINNENVKTINNFLLDPENPLMKSVLETINKYGTPEEINRKAKEAGKLENLMNRLKAKNSPYVKDLEWLIEQKEKGAFIKLEDYYKKILGDKYESTKMKEGYAVTMELSALQFFPFFIEEAKQAIANQELMPGRYIKVRNMVEQVEDDQLLASSIAMKIIGASYVETLDTKGTDGSNVHLGGPETITGYFGGIGQPNTHALKWLDEFLHYYTEYGVQQVLNINPGTILIGYLLYRLGVDIEFKISVYMGNDNPYSVLWTMMTAKLFAREDGTTPLIGFNFSNSVNNETIELADFPRKAFGFEDIVRIEHHIFETWKSIVRQPYDRRAELVEVSAKVKNISAKHEGGDIEVEKSREHPSDILEYFLPKEEIMKQGLMGFLTRNYMDKHDSIKGTADALIKAGIPVIVARNLH
ncbi:hypothetical protein DSAG12_01416 [Promethearchaeum syntrophicum]|uniref:Uncharacterized protein n=1 Tax=Promethearchaeum syntrophicum TaxID=2594042 RepID=A0A5B9DA14_9ARCH|nr:hypothetical protein [Candidatus Prometheoarchaeum syntrophicum]QEE15590.1 hypothetical protein DSAG12_01416 [Candidatus Prometheoarchaeum syntrophicum]